MKPVIFVLGLSGAGKTHTSKVLGEEYLLLHIDIDRTGGGFARAGFPGEWDEDVSRVDFLILAAGVRMQVTDEYQGAILSFPTTYVFSREQLDVASRHGVSTVVLWGTLEHCMEARREREEKRGKTFYPNRYLRKNTPTFDTYRSAEYDEFKVAAFQLDGYRPSRETLLSLVLERLANQGIELTASTAFGTRYR